MGKTRIDIDISHEDMQDFFDVVNFLETNRSELIADIKPLVQRYLERDDFFTGPFKVEYDNHFPVLVLDLLKERVMDNLNLNYEEASNLMDPEMMEVTGILDLFVNRELYNG